jgi:hypothetical protein
MSQYDGLMDGYECSMQLLLLCIDTSSFFRSYNAHAQTNKTLDAFAFFILNGDGDIDDILTAACPSLAPDWDHMNKTEFLSYVSFPRRHILSFITNRANPV